MSEEGVGSERDKRGEKSKKREGVSYFFLAYMISTKNLQKLQLLPIFVNTFGPHTNLGAFILVDVITHVSMNDVCSLFHLYLFYLFHFSHFYLSLLSTIFFHSFTLCLFFFVFLINFFR